MPKGGKKAAAAVFVVLALFVLMGIFPDAPAFALSNSNKIAYPAAYDWAMFQRTANHTGSVVSPGPLSNKMVGEVNFTGSIYGSGALVGGALYFGSGSVFHAVNSSNINSTATGFVPQQGWNFTVEGSLHSSPAVGDGNVFVGSTNGSLFAFGATLAGCTPTPTCHLKWIKGTGGPIYSSPSYDNGYVFVGSDDGNVYCFNALNGHTVWSYSTKGSVRSSPAVSGSMVVVGSDDGRVYFLNESTGALVFSFKTRGPVESSPAVADGVAFFGSNDTMFYAVTISTMALNWKIGLGGAVISSPSVADGVVYVGSTNGTEYALKMSHKHVYWSVDIGPVVAPAALANGVDKKTRTFIPLLYVPSLDGTLYALERKSGSVAWSLPIAKDTVSPVAVGYTKVYIGDSFGTLRQIGSLRNGTAVATFQGTMLDKKFLPGDHVTVGADSAWGRYGINQTLVTITDPLGHVIVDNATMQFTTGFSGYNFWSGFNLSPTAPVGKYKITLFVEDANIKTGSHNPRCCGWVVVKGAFQVT
jgi:outer membrane protein assembly factor BamB